MFLKHTKDNGGPHRDRALSQSFDYTNNTDSTRFNSLDCDYTAEKPRPRRSSNSEIRLLHIRLKE